MNKEPVQSEKEYIDRIPFVSELLKRIDDISQSIRHGETGEEEALNLITDMPDSWLTEIQPRLDEIEKTYTNKKHEIDKCYLRGTPQSYKQGLSGLRVEAGKEYSRQIKRTIINLLDKKGMLFLTKAVVPESHFSRLTLDP